MCPFKYRKIHELFTYIHDHHKANGTDPKEWYDVLRSIIQDRSIVTGKNRMRAMMHNLTALRAKHPNHDDFFNWFYKLFRSHHPKVVEAVPEPAKVEVATNDTITPKQPIIDTTCALDEREAHSINIKDVKTSIDNTVEPKRRRRWWLLFMA